MPKASFSSRATDTVTLKIGLIPIVLNIFSGFDSTSGVTRHQYLPVPVMVDDGNGGQVQQTVKRTLDDGTEVDEPVFENVPVGRTATNKITGEPLDEAEKTQVQSKVETEYGPVYVEDGEIERLFTLSQKSIRILSVQPQTLFYQGDHYVPKKMSYVEPVKIKTGKQKGQYDQDSMQLYATFMETLRKDGRMAVVEITTRGVPRPAVLLPNGRLYEVYHTDEVREQRQVDLPETNPAEVAMFKTLLETEGLVSDEPLDLSDERAALINDFAKEKAQAGDFGKPAEVGDAPAPVQQTGVNLLALLSASVEAAKAS